MAEGKTLQIKRGLASTIGTLAAGELGFTTDTEVLYVGDGATNHIIGPAPAAGQPTLNGNGTAGVVQFASWIAASVGTDNSLAINALELGTIAALKASLSGATFTGAVVVPDHGTATNPEVVAVVYGTGSPPTASTTPIGTLFMQYTP
jgi:hypothetical protein